LDKNPARPPHRSRVANALESLVRFIGHSIAWLTVIMVVAMAVVVVERYWFDSGSIQLQESITFMHAAVFMLAAAYTLAAEDHVRVDIFYSTMRPERKALVDLLGTLLLLVPFCAFLIWSSWDYVATSWLIRESSPETGGLPYPFPALMKSFIPAASFLLLIQGVVIILDSAAIITGRNSAIADVKS